MTPQVTSTDQVVVSPAHNRKKLERIEADVANVLKAMVRSEESERSISAKIVCAGVQMLDIQRTDLDAWEAFKNADPKAKEINCKGLHRESREVTTVLWRQHRASFPSRERISLYSKAIRVAHAAYWAEEKGDPEKILKRIVDAGGVKGVLKINKVAKGRTGRKKIVHDIPPTLTLFLCGPDGSCEALEPERNRRYLIDMGRLQ